MCQEGIDRVQAKVPVGLQKDDTTTCTFVEMLGK